MLFPASVADAEGVGAQAGAAVTAGSGGYHRVAVFLDAEKARGTLRPYGWLEGSDDDYVRKFGLGGGVWAEAAPDIAVKGGAGATIGRLKDSDLSVGSLTLETGLERSLERAALGGEYRLTFGSLADARAPASVEKDLPPRARGRRARGEETERFRIHELAAYGRVYVGSTQWGLRGALILPSYSGVIVTETLSCRIPVAESVRVTPALTFEQGAQRGVYGTLAASVLF